MCPELYAPLKEGFYSPPAGHRPSGDDDDEKLKQSCQRMPANPSLCLKQSSKSAMLSPTKPLIWNTTAAVMV